MKICSKCRIEKELTGFHKNKSKKSGFQSWCINCIKKFRKKADPEKHNKQSLLWYYKNKIEIKIKQAKYYKSNSSIIKQKISQYRKDNKGKVNALNAKHHAIKLQRTPSWANLEAIKKFYINCPKDKEVDHIVPLQGKTVSGFHVEYNLQYLTKSENCKKHNKF